ncbi:MAG: P-loop NTPase fold protein [bacterium]
MDWLEDLGFVGNPFFLEPIDSSLKGFVNRTKEKDSLEKCIITRRGKYILVGSIGLGKTSLLNIMEGYSKDNGFMIIKTDFLHQQSKEDFYNQLIKGLEDIVEKYPKIKKKIEKMLEKTQIISRRKKKGAKTKPEVSSKISAILIEFAAKVIGESEETEDIEFFVPPYLQQAIDVFNESTKIITDEKPLIIISDNLDKLTPEAFNTILKSIIDALPTHLVFLTTGNYTHLSLENVALAQNVFDLNIDIPEIETTAQIREFVDGRMMAFSKNTSVSPIHFPNDVLNLLLEKTKGNLRETFRYCFGAIVEYGNQISRDNMIKTIKTIDATLLKNVDERDKDILKNMKEEKTYTLSQLSQIANIHKKTLWGRIKNLIQLNLIFKESAGKGRGKEDRYYIPAVIKEIIE